MNAKQELQRHFDMIGKKPVCAMIYDSGGLGDMNITLKKGYTDQEFEKFMEDLDFEYDAGWGSQCIGGTVWFGDGTWLTRNEYDGSEWWAYLYTPKIPDHLL